MSEKMSTKKKMLKTELSRAVSNIKKHIESGGPATATVSKEVKKPTTKNKVFKGRGVVYLSHIPHGFYEKEMQGFFSQFGRVTRLRLVRSHKTGNSSGYAFIEFLFSEVAQVVAETMNNYLMRNRLLKAHYIPPEKQNPKMFIHSKDYGPETCLGLRRRRRTVEAQNKHLSDDKSLQQVNRHKEKLQKLQEKLKAQGVDFLFQVDKGTSEILVPKKSSMKSSQSQANKTAVKPVITKNVKVQKLNAKNTSSNTNVSKKSNVKDSNAKKLDVKKITVKNANAKKLNVKKIGSVKDAGAKKLNVKKIGNVKDANAKKLNVKKVSSVKDANVKKVTGKKITNVKEKNAKKINIKKISKTKDVNAKKSNIKKPAKKKEVAKHK